MENSSDVTEVPNKKIRIGLEDHSVKDVITFKNLQETPNTNPFMRAFKDPLSSHEPDDLIEAIAPEQRLEDQDFDQEKVMQHLIKIAESQNITPQQLYADIKTLIFAEHQLKNGETVGDTIKTLKCLKNKYDVTELAAEQDSVTIFRLQIMFPQFSCLLADILLPHRMALFMTEWDPANYCSEGAECGNYKKLMSANAILRVPPGLKIQAFPSIIPIKAVGVLNERNRQEIIVAHVVYQITLNYFIKKEVPFRSLLYHGTLAKIQMQIQNGLLSDERRLRVLQNIGVVHLNGKLRETVSEAIEHFKSRFAEIFELIDFRIFGFDYKNDGESEDYMRD